MLVAQRLMDFNEAVDLALRITTEIDFTLAEQGRLFGLKGSVGDNPDYLARELKVVSKDKVGIEQRCNLVFEIKAALEAIFPDDLPRQKLWLNAPQEALAGKTSKALMSSGDLADLQQVARLLEKVTG